MSGTSTGRFKAGSQSISGGYDHLKQYCAEAAHTDFREPVCTSHLKFMFNRNFKS
jgi:hypothetical protein